MGQGTQQRSALELKPVFIAVVACFALPWARATAVQPARLFHHEATRMSMACAYAIDAYGPDAAALPGIVDEAFDEVDRIDRLMSHYKPESPLSRLNRDAANHPVTVDPELFDFIADAMRYNRESSGAFDITVGPLMKAWGFFGGDGRLPTDAALANARSLVGSTHVRMDRAARTISFDRPGVELDLGGIAKGYAVDRAVGILKQHHVAAALVSAGGSTIYALGAPPGKRAWDISIQDPLDPRRIAQTIELKDRALSVAGSSEKWFEAGGVRYSHIMNPRTGMPVQGILTVVVLAPTGTAGDALDDAFFVMGPEGSASYRSQLPDVEPLFFLSDGSGWRMVRPGQRHGPDFDFEALPFAPAHYVAYRTPAALKIDGKLDEASWSAAPWSDLFVDIEGDRQPRPPFRTRMKMLWDDDNLYVAADLQEPDVWATLRERDSVIFRDNDFELFIDPDGDTHAYYELEVNAFATPWDLLLIKPYRDGGPAIHGWDIAGLRVGADVRGTLNETGDRDDGWSVELAMPWKILREAAQGHRAPTAGDRWRINFSRVEWDVDIRDGRYQKRLKPGTNDPLPEHNWVWSPQGAIDMHMPERWGYVQFSSRAAGAGVDTFVDDPNERVKWALRRLYYRQRRLREKTGRYAATIDALDPGNIRIEGLTFRPALASTPLMYEISTEGFGGAVVHINEEGRVWITRR